MSNQIELLSNAGAGATGKAVTLAADDLFVKVTASTWGGQTVKFQERAADGSWSDIPGAVFTVDDAKVYQGYRNQTLRAVTSGSGGSMAGVYVMVGQRFD
ncbi:hypothetical protein [Marinobacter salarius]|uniref:hypothetical protein n=1 Tax=Marinobacter salarius TaxID=1420917 RepID=UPI003BAB02A3